MSGAFLKKALSAVLALMLTMAAALSLPGAAAAEPEDRYVTVVLHAGENGFFGEEDVHELESVQFFGDCFTEKRVPESEDPAMMFAGWATEEGAARADVFSGKTYVSEAGTDLYAVWTDECTVRYVAEGGHIDTGLDQYEEYETTCAPGTAFAPMDAVPGDAERYDFAGWFVILPDGSFERITEETLIEDVETVVHARWILSAERTEAMEEGVPYDIESEGDPQVFSFMPEETGFYSILTQDAEGGASLIRVMDVYGIALDEASAEEDESDAVLCTELKAGETYFIFFSDKDGIELFGTALIEKAESAVITFHANRGQEEDAWFGDDGTAAETAIPIALGKDISGYAGTGLTLKDPLALEFIGWSADPDAGTVEELTVESDTEVYAVYRSLRTLTLDANGGTFGEQGGALTLPYPFAEGETFTGAFEPQHDDNRIKFAGWSADPDAEVPDGDIVEGQTLCEDLPEVLYAVYAEKVLVTFDANGGHSPDASDEQGCRMSVGKGHVFTGVPVVHEDPQKTLLGWSDEDGTFIPFADQEEEPYRIERDMLFTAVWGHAVCIDANTGTFGEDGKNVLFVLLPDEEPLDLTSVREEIALLRHENPNKIFMGWARTPDAAEPDTYEGETLVMDLDTVYAVWQDDVYYFEEGDGAVYEKNNGDGLRFTVRRELDDSRTYEAFSTAFIDGKALPSRAYTVHENGLILILDPDYLNELEAGDHELTLLFGDQEVTARFTVLEHEEESSEEVPTEPTEELPTEPTEELPTEPTDAPAPTEPIDTSAVENRRLGPFWVSLVALLGIGLLIYYRIMKRGEPKNVYVAPPEKDPQTIASQLAVDAGLMSPAAQAKIEETVEERTAEADEKATNAEESTADPAKLTEDPAESTDADAPEATAEEVKE